MTELEMVHPQVERRSESSTMQYARAFAGLFLRDRRLRELLPLRS